MNDAGRIGFVIRDDYDNNVQYDFLDVVYYHGNSYVAKKLTLGNIPNENNEYWHILAAGGVRVKGDAETEYRDGDVNITKADIGLRETENKSSETIRSEITSENVTDALGYTPIKGVKGEAETAYRTGEVNLTPENLGIDIMQGATSTEAGKAGLVPAPSAGDEKKYLQQDGTWGVSKIFNHTKLITTGKGWYRLLEIATNDGIVQGLNILLQLNSTYWNNRDAAMLFSISGSYSNHITYKSLNISYSTENIFTKLRFAKEDKTIYLEAYYDTNNQNEIVFSTFVDYKLKILNSKLDEATEDETMISEYTIPASDDIQVVNDRIMVVRKTLNGVGWYRIAKFPLSTFRAGQCGIINIARNYGNHVSESHILTFTTTPHKETKFNLINTHYHNAENRIITKIRTASDGTASYLEIHYDANKNNNVSIEVVLNYLTDNAHSVGLDPAIETETTIDEYIIPEKDDFETSTSLTRFVEIPEGADMHTYLTPGNYCCSSDAKAKTLKNCPLSGAFTMVVMLPTGNSAYKKQIYKSYSGALTAEVTVNNQGSWYSPNYFMHYQGTPPANKLWGTDANGNVGWIDPPLGNVFVCEHRHNSDGYVKFATITVRNNGWRSQPLIMDFLRYAGFYTKLIYSATSGLLRTDANLIASNVTTENIEIMCVETSSTVTDLYVHVGNGSAISTAVVVNPYDVYRIEFHNFTNVEAITKEAVQALGTKVYSSKRASVA